ncbi:MAG: molybdopterin molybdotransferase MoeA [Chryseolinea sp.]
MYLVKNKGKINPMVSVAEASSIVLNHLVKPLEVVLNLSHAVGRVLAETIVADRDLPPVNRVTMDGIAIAFAAVQSDIQKFSIEGTMAAGMPAKVLGNKINCFEVMTGAVLPGNTDTVIPYEDILVDGKMATLQTASVKQGQNIHYQGADAKAGSLLLSAGMILSPAEIALLASVGRAEIKVYDFPKTAIISSGDELVSVETRPLPHQVRRSNSFAIHAAMQMMGWDGELFHLADVKEDMKISLREIISKFDVLILSGGVSKGKYDFVPEVMEELGISKLIHRVSQRPGKPFWFGASKNKVVFALPGNPVSTYMCFYRYIRLWILSSMNVNATESHVILAEDFKPLHDLTYFLQVRVYNESGKLMARPEVGGGSGDFANLKLVTGFIELPPAKSMYLKGQVFRYFSFR